MSKKALACVVALIALVVLSAVAYGGPAAGQASGSNFGQYVTSSVQAINGTQIRSFAETLSSFGSRVTGYPGNIRAAKFIEETLRSYGIKVVNQSFTVAIPMDRGSWIYVPGTNENLTAYGLWPNGPVTGGSEGYVEGPLVYAGNGTLQDLDGKKINGSIVLEDFNSGDNWLYAAQLGAKAIIFLAPQSTTSLQSTLKASPDPLYMPRLYVEGEAAKSLLKLALSNREVEVHDGVFWVNATSYNVIGEINGTEDPNEIVVASAHYDSWSVVPALAPGGEDALGISTLLDLARYFSSNRPYRTLWLVAYSGYWEGLEGPTQFVYENLFSNWNLNGNAHIYMDVDLDLSSGSNQLDGLYYGLFNSFDMGSYGESRYQGYLSSMTQQFLTAAGISSTLPNGLPVIQYYMHGTADWGTQDTFYMLDVEPWVQTGTMAFTLRTSFDSRESWLTPLNDLAGVNWSDVIQQARVAAAVIAGFSDVSSLGLSWGSDRPSVIAYTPAGYIGFAQVDVRVVEFNYSNSWYNSVSDALVQVPRGPCEDPSWWEFGDQWFLTTSNGTYQYEGAVPYQSYTFLAWKVNDTTGQIDFAPNEGLYGTAHGVSGGLMTTIPLVASSPSYISVPVFHAEPVTVFNLIDPRTMSPAYIYDPRNSDLDFFSEPAVVSVYDEITKAQPISYYVYYDPATTLSTVFVEKGENIVITFNPDPTVTSPLAVLDNASAAHPQGEGYLINGPTEITNTFLQEAEDDYLLVESRYGELQLHYARSDGLEKLMTAARGYMSYAQGNMSALNYSAAYDESLAAWAYSSNAYATQLMPMYGQISGSMMFFTLLIVPFAYFFEEYVLNVSGIKKIIAIAVILGITIYVFSLINPSLSVISNSTLSILGIGLLLFFLLVTWIFYGEIKEIISEGAQSRIGAHKMAGSSTAVAMHSISTAVSNMRRRKLLSSLTLLTVVAFAAGNVALTSSSSSIGVAQTSVSSTVFAPNGAIYVSWYDGMPTDIMGNYVVNYLKGIGGNQFDYWPVYIYYPSLIYGMGPISRETAVLTESPQSSNVSLQLLAFVGMTPQQAAQYYSKYLVSGSFNVTGNGIAIPESLARAMNITVGDTLEFKGVGTYRVVGIFNSQVSGSNFNGWPIIPISPSYNSIADEGYTTPFTSVGIPAPLLPSQFVVVSSEDARELGGFLTGVEVYPKANMSGAELVNYAELMRYPIIPTVYAQPAASHSSKALSVVATYSFMGVSLTLALSLMAAVAILNAIYEGVMFRRREILTYASLGLSPRGAEIMFLTESLVYALLGAVLGFLLGFFLDFIFITYHVLPSSYAFNFTSSSMILSLLIILLATILGSLYPSYVSGKMITPSLERRWKPSTRPRGNEWTVPMPVKTSMKDEALAILRYLHEYYREVGYEKAAFRVEGNPTLDEQNMALSVIVRLEPFEMGIIQQAQISFVANRAGQLEMQLYLKLQSGDLNLWRSRNIAFMQDLRDQLMLWRSIRPSERQRYFTQGSGANAGSGASTGGNAAPRRG
ncbi:M28 family peptidase [Tardisphaera miroshnichenkoae]